MKRMKQLLQAATSQRTLQAATGLRTLQASIGQRTALIPALLLCLLAMAGCSQDEPANGQPDNDNTTGQKITITASMPDGGADTRLVYEDETTGAGTGKLVVKWKESGEKIYIYNKARNTTSTFTQTGTLSADGKKTDFTGKLPEGTLNGDELCAYYNNGITDDNYAITKLTEHKSIKSNGSLDGMVHAMYAKTKYQGELPVNFGFQFLTAALKLTLEGIPGNVTISSLQLKGQNVVQTGITDFTQSPCIVAPGKAMEQIASPSLTSEGTFYTALFGMSLPEGMTVTATGSDNKEYVATLPAIDINAGNIYVATLTLTEREKKTVANADDLKTELESTTAKTIIIDSDMTLSERIEMGANHTLTVNRDKKLTSSDKGGIDVYSPKGTFSLTVNGGGTLISSNATANILAGGKGSVSLENITVLLQNTQSNGISVKTLNVGDNATIKLNSTTASNQLAIDQDCILNINQGGTVLIEEFNSVGINNFGTINIYNGGTLTVKQGAGENFGISNAASTAINLEVFAGGTLNGESNGTIRLIQGDDVGSIVKGVNNLFQDGTSVLEYSGKVTTAPENAEKSVQGLTAGVYTWDDTQSRFIKN